MKNTLSQGLVVPDFVSAVRAANIVVERHFESTQLKEEADIARYRSEAKMYKRFCAGMYGNLDDGGRVEVAAKLAVKCLLNPPKGVGVFLRNPKYEYPNFGSLLLSDVRPKIVVPTCPDGDQYKLSDGIGAVGEKALGYAPVLHELFVGAGFDGIDYEIQIADVEARDAAVLEASGETTESHFAKTTVTRQKTVKEISRRNLSSYVTVTSMDEQFCGRDLSYSAMQNQAAIPIGSSEDSRTQKTIEGLLTERRRLGDFDAVPEEDHRRMVIAELAGYAAYGKMIGGVAVIASPDAASAIPAYHYGAAQPSEHSPVMYLRGQQ